MRDPVSFLAEIERLRELHRDLVEADVYRKRYRYLLNEFVDSARVLFGDKTLVYRNVYDKIYDVSLDKQVRDAVALFVDERMNATTNNEVENHD